VLFAEHKGPTVEVARTSEELRARSVLLAIALFSAGVFLLFGVRVLTSFTSTYVGGNGPDPKLFIWSMEWWSRALFHASNPLHAGAIWAPAGYDLSWATTVPGPAVAVAPITWILGPIASYNVLILLAPVLSATSAFFLCFAVTNRFWPSIAGGYSFGFSSYMLAHIRGGHLNMLLVFAVPLVAALVILRMKDRIGTSRFVALLTALLIVQFLVSTEVFATLTVIGGLALFLACVYADLDGRRRILRLLPSIGIAYLCSTVLLLPLLLAAFIGPLPSQHIDAAGGSTDLLNLIIPTSVTWVGGRAMSGIAGSFSGSVSGQGAYLGLPILIIVSLFAWERRRSFAGRFLPALFVAIFLLSLGPVLMIGGTSTHVPMPGIAFRFLPLLGRAILGRLLVYALAALAVMIAMWLSEPRRRYWRVAVVVIGTALLLPAPRDWMWETTPYVPRFFLTGQYEALLAPQQNVLVLTRTSALPLVWQAETHLYFFMPTGYTGGFPPSTGHTLSSQFLYRQQCPPGGLSPAVQGFFIQRGVTTLIVPESGREAAGCLTLATQTAGVTTVGGVRVYRLAG
jgi:hypothetical protein